MSEILPPEANDCSMTILTRVRGLEEESREMNSCGHSVNNNPVRGRIESLKAEIKKWVDIADKQQQEMETLEDVQVALENRCRVAEDLNKVYVRMYLEMQQKYDDMVEKYWRELEEEWMN